MPAQSHINPAITKMLYEKGIFNINHHNYLVSENTLISHRDISLRIQAISNTNNTNYKLHKYIMKSFLAS